MSASDLFGVAVRVCGLLSVLLSLALFWRVYVITSNPVFHSVANEVGLDSLVRTSVVGAIGALIIGLILLRFAWMVVSFSYPGIDVVDRD